MKTRFPKRDRNLLHQIEKQLLDLEKKLDRPDFFPYQNQIKREIQNKEMIYDNYLHFLESQYGDKL